MTTAPDPNAAPTVQASQVVQPSGIVPLVYSEGGRLKVSVGNSLGFWGAVVAIIASLVGLPVAGGALSQKGADDRIDERVGTALDKRFDEKMGPKFKALADQQEEVAKASKTTTEAVRSLTELVVKQGAEAEAQRKLDAQAQANLDRRVTDHEDRIRQLERSGHR
jgi:hypothetical protein